MIQLIGAISVALTNERKNFEIRPIAAPKIKAIRRLRMKRPAMNPPIPAIPRRLATKTAISPAIRREIRFSRSFNAYRVRICKINYPQQNPIHSAPPQKNSAVDSTETGWLDSRTRFGRRTFSCAPRNLTPTRCGHPTPSALRSMLSATSVRNTPKTRLSGLGSSAWASRTPSGAVSMVIAITTRKAGRFTAPSV